MESWRLVWRQGFVPVLSTKALEALRDACFNNDPALIQGSTSTPPPLLCMADWPVEAGCMIGYCGWKGEGLERVGQVEEYWAGVCREADALLGEPAACRYALNWYDETPREEVLRELFFECERALAERQKAAGAA